MMLTLVLDILLAVLAVSMLLFGRFGATRQAALIPLAMAALDLYLHGVLSFSLWTVAVAALQMVVLCVGGLVLYRDRVRARNKQARRARRREITRSRADFEQALEQREQCARRRRVCA